MDLDELVNIAGHETEPVVEPEEIPEPPVVKKPAKKEVDKTVIMRGRSTTNFITLKQVEEMIHSVRYGTSLGGGTLLLALKVAQKALMGSGYYEFPVPDDDISI